MVPLTLTYWTSYPWHSRVEREGYITTPFLPKFRNFVFGILSLGGFGPHKSIIPYQGPGKQK